LFDQPIKRCDAIFGFAAAEDFGVVDIQRTEIHPGPAAFVSILDTTSTTRLTGFGGMDAAAGLNAST
jgi:hypothetical protein